MFKLFRKRENKNPQKKLPFEYIIVPGENAVSTLLKMKKEKQNITPVILGDKTSFNALVKGLDGNPLTFEEIMSESLKFNLDTFKNKHAFIYSIKEDENKNKSISKEFQIWAHYDFEKRKPFEEVYIGLFPTDKSYEIPAYLKFGGNNDCPETVEHVGLLKYWSKKYNIEIMSFTTDVLECWIKNPPQTLDEATDLAYLQACYCKNIVLQGTESLKGLTKQLINNVYWYFWWD